MHPRTDFSELMKQEFGFNHRQRRLGPEPVMLRRDKPTRESWPLSKLP